MGLATARAFAEAGAAVVLEDAALAEQPAAVAPAPEPVAAAVEAAPAKPKRRRGKQAEATAA